MAQVRCEVAPTAVNGDVARLARPRVVSSVAVLLFPVAREVGAHTLWRTSKWLTTYAAFALHYALLR